MRKPSKQLRLVRGDGGTATCPYWRWLCTDKDNRVFEFEVLGKGALSRAVHLAKYAVSDLNGAATVVVKSRRKREGYRPWMKAKATKEVYRRAAEYSRRMTKNGVDFSKRMNAMSPAFAMGYAIGWGLEVKNPNSVARIPST